MSITLFNLIRGSVFRGSVFRGSVFRGSVFRAGASGARWLGALSIGSALALGACSASDSSDDPLAEEPTDVGEPMTATPSAPPGDEPEPAPTGSSDEDGPDVTGFDDSTAPGDQENNSPSEAEGDPDQQAAGMSMLPGTADVPDTELCAAVADWDPEWVQFEEEVLLLVNEFRSQPADCGVEGQFEAAGPLSMNPILRCSARLHSLDMFERNYFEHETPDGVDPFERMAAAGFVGSGGGENIARGQQTPEQVMADWMESDGHCANVMRGVFDTIGVGYHPGSGMRGGNNDYWTQNFGAAPFMRGGNRR